MAKLRFIKPWGPHKPGDIKETASPSTIHWLVDVYKLAIIESPASARAKPAPAPAPVMDIYKYIPKSPQDKMVAGAPKTKRGKRYGQ